MITTVSLEVILLAVLLVFSALVVVRSLRMPAAFEQNEQKRAKMRKERLDAVFEGEDDEDGVADEKNAQDDEQASEDPKSA
ncbi:MAG: hypothetical protein GF344_18615 [Chitinivibrionales bacterium]|nr:hypothetical protein [Chitinivibrionales bacterium]MBD3358662.1 hypothetical protein [Chitinivibrionales bacterium]